MFNSPAILVINNHCDVGEEWNELLKGHKAVTNWILHRRPAPFKVIADCIDDMSSFSKHVLVKEKAAEDNTERGDSDDDENALEDKIEGGTKDNRLQAFCVNACKNRHNHEPCCQKPREANAYLPSGWMVY
ncbi:hypothetical protein ColTof4_14070 [Colletotrichum tofieldiae]|nr:hypothetical protein ColTof3_14707 [Colletotrichum tofieldiae]GKT81647.1 hypothetical protein ColTof4_14070 [Colletotrichum tofieldiae]